MVKMVSTLEQCLSLKMVRHCLKKGVAQIVLKAEKVTKLFNVAEVNNSWYGFTFAAQLDRSNN